jgi:AraC-like DNA-binding protein
MCPNTPIKEDNSPILHLAGGDTIGPKPIIYRRKAYSYWCIEYIAEGAGYLIVDDQQFQINCTDVYILPKGKDHEYGPDKNNPWRKKYVVIDGPLIEELTKIYGIQNTYFFPQQLSTGHLFDKLIETLKTKDENTFTKISLLIHEIIIHLASQVKHRKENDKGLPGKIKRFLDGSLENPLKLEDLVNEFHCTKAHLVRTFKKQYKMTPYEYFLSRKFNLACFYLTQTDISIKQIADKLHFRDEYYFSKFFSQRAKTPPGQFRKKRVESF